MRSLLLRRPLSSLRSMDLLKQTAHLDPAPRLPNIDSYDARSFTLGGNLYPGGVLLLNGAVFRWKARDGSDLGAGALAPLLQLLPHPELVVVGTGASILPIPHEWRQRLREAGIAVELADTRNAIATYNILAEEGRKVAAALMPIDNDT